MPLLPHEFHGKRPAAFMKNLPLRMLPYAIPFVIVAHFLSLTCVQTASLQCYNSRICFHSPLLHARLALLCNAGNNVCACYAGLMITTLVSYLSHSQIWALQREAMLHVGGRTNRATIAFAGELSAVLDLVPDRASSQTSSQQRQANGALGAAVGPLYLESSTGQVKQAEPGAGANRNPDYVPNDTAGNLGGSSIGFASIDEVDT